jgi:hypothetical protein
MINASYCSGTHWDPRAAVVHYEHHHCHGTHWNPRSGQVNDTLPAIAAPPIGTRMQQWLVWLVGWLVNDTTNHSCGTHWDPPGPVVTSAVLYSDTCNCSSTHWNPRSAVVHSVTCNCSGTH